jgi:transcription-repair coupling factor (superfamily II helicase)
MLPMVDTSLQEAVQLLDVEGCVSVGPVHGSFASLASASLSQNRGVLFVAAHIDDADETVAMLQELGVSVASFPALESEVSKDIVAQRYALLDNLHRKEMPEVLVASVPALMQKTPSIEQVQSVVRRIRVGDECSLQTLQHWLVDASYERVETLDESAQFSLRGGILDIATAAGEFVRLDFFGDTVETWPLCPDSILAVCAQLKASGYRSAPNFV